jgi:hypothetical protein
MLALVAFVLLIPPFGAVGAASTLVLLSVITYGLQLIVLRRRYGARMLRRNAILAARPVATRASVVGPLALALALCSRRDPRRVLMSPRQTKECSTSVQGSDRFFPNRLTVDRADVAEHFVAKAYHLTPHFGN